MIESVPTKANRQDAFLRHCVVTVQGRLQAVCQEYQELADEMRQSMQASRDDQNKCTEKVVQASEVFVRPKTE